MSENRQRKSSGRRRFVPVGITGAVLGLVLILVTLEIIHRGTLAFVVAQQRYILSAEVALFGIFITEVVARLIAAGLHTHGARNLGARFRIMVRVTGYSVAVISVVSILASNPTLGISVGTIAGVVIAFATQNIVGNVLAAVLIMNSRMIRIGEEINVSGVQGVVTDITLTHTIINVNEDEVYVPNSLLMSSPVRRRKR